MLRTTITTIALLAALNACASGVIPANDAEAHRDDFPLNVAARHHRRSITIPFRGATLLMNFRDSHSPGSLKDTTPGRVWLLVPGVPAPPAEMWALEPHLKDRVILPELPGGNGVLRVVAGAIDWSDWSIQDHAELLAAFVRALSVELGDVELVAVGWSYGGWTAAELALRYPDLIDALALINAAGFPRTASERTWSDFFVANVPEWLLARFIDRESIAENLAEGGFFLPSQIDLGQLADLYVWAMKAEPCLTVIKALTQAERSLDDDAADRFSSRLSQLSKNTLILQAKQDPWTSPMSQGTRYARAIPNSDYREIDRARHSICFEHSEMVANHLEGWLGPDPELHEKSQEGGAPRCRWSALESSSWGITASSSGRR